MPGKGLYPKKNVFLVVNVQQKVFQYDKCIIDPSLSFGNWNLKRHTLSSNIRQHIVDLLIMNVVISQYGSESAGYNMVQNRDSAFSH